MNGHAGDLPSKGTGAGGCPDQKVNPATIENLHRVTQKEWVGQKRLHRVIGLVEGARRSLRFKER